MKTIQLHNQTVCYDSYNFESKTELREFLESSEIKNILKNVKEDVIMVLGGDGTILRAIRKHYKKEKAFLPINFGTKGFLLNNKKFIDSDSEFISREYPLIKAKVEKQNGEIIEDIAFNEIVIKDINGKMVDLNIKIKNKNSLNLQGDGILISTPAGSTGYNSSLYGPIIPHTSRSFIMTPMAAWNPKRHPASIIENKNIINIKNQNRLGEIGIFADGQEVLKTGEEKIKVEIKKSRFKAKLLISKNYEDAWDNKVLQEQGFNN